MKIKLFDCSKFYKQHKFLVLISIFSLVVSFGAYIGTIASQNQYNKLLNSKKQCVAGVCSKEVPIDNEGKFCGGIAAFQCPDGYRCKLDGSYPDAGGVCVMDFRDKNK